MMLEHAEKGTRGQDCPRLVVQGMDCASIAAFQWKIRESSIHCTISVTTLACAVPPAAVAVTAICVVPKAVGTASVTNAEPPVVASVEVAVTVAVCGFGTMAGAV